MRDIVEWLRASYARTTVIDIKRLDEAADTIERFRTALERIAACKTFSNPAYMIVIAQAALEEKA